MPKKTASQKMKRLLAIIPWVVANPGESLQNIADRFGISTKELLDDLSVIHMVGLPPYTPDSLVDVEIDDEGCVFIRLADYFSRPLRLSPSQGLALLTSSEALLSVPGADVDGALATALKKLEQVLGIDGHEVLDVHLGEADELLLDQLRQCILEGLEAEISYYSYGRDVQSVRKVLPWRIVADIGNWYLHAWCHEADGERLFRVDRIEHLKILEQTTATKSVKPLKKLFNSRAEDPRVTLLLAKEAMWVLEAYPYDKILHNEDNKVELTLAVTAKPWLERLLMRLGANAEVVSSENIDAKNVAFEAAGKILERYGS